jgi:hypothetical protein
MNARQSLFAIILTLATAGAGLAQEYQLGWDQLNEGSSAKEKAYTLNWEDVSAHVERSAPQPQAELAPEMPEKGKVAMMGPIEELRPPSSARRSVPTQNIEFSASQYYDSYASRYLRVTRVEVETFRMGTYTCETFENRGAWNTFPVYVNNLKQGERYRVRVVWDNGSNRTLDKTVDTYTPDTVYINQPDYLAYSANW